MKRIQKGGGRREEKNYSLFSLLPPPFLSKSRLELNSLNKPQFLLISLIILLIISVDNSVDKLWISCGWSCG
jgi:hypothetical protein